MPMRPSVLALVLALPCLQTQVLPAQETPIDTARSTITIHAGKAGLLSAAGHDHWIIAPIFSGVIRDSGVEFKVESAKMLVKPDPKVDAKTRASIQKDMETMTLETSKFPEISFQSTRVQPSGADQWKVEGNLALHGVTKLITLVVKRSNGAYIGHTTLKQTDFGIKPVSVGGGMVRVKNEIEIDFEVYPK
jgi:polyisoprenoid-binding protein YceI